jgi:transcriptional regulator with XRE-family HTH domain
VSPAGQPSRRAAAAVLAELERQERSQAWLARQIGLDAAAVGRRLRGETPIDLDELVAIASALGVDPQALLD